MLLGGSGSRVPQVALHAVKDVDQGIMSVAIDRADLTS